MIENIGDFDKRVTISTPGSSASDGMGGSASTSAATTVEIWAKVRSMTPKEKLLLGLSIGSLAYVILVRYENGKALNRDDVITYNGKTLYVLGTTDIEEEHLLINIYASGRV